MDGSEWRPGLGRQHKEVLMSLRSWSVGAGTESPHRDVFVLSGGAARGAVQVGMAEVLLSQGIRPTALVGTSVGALNAAFLAAEPTAERAQALANHWLALKTADIFPGGNWSRVAHLAKRRPYLFSNEALRSLIARWVPARHLEELAVPLRVTTTPLAGNQAVYHHSGPLTPLLLASAAVPGVFAPVSLRSSTGHLVPHVDGGVADLVPITGAREFAPTRVFVLDATVPARLPHGRTPLDVIVASLSVAMRARPLPELGPDVEVIHLHTADLGTRMTDFSRTADHLALGRAVAEAAIADRLRPAPSSHGPSRIRRLFGHAA